MKVLIAVILCMISLIAIIVSGAKTWQLGSFFVIVFVSYLVYKKSKVK
jgi:membrane protein implicated in regulation of membrane protease activity